MHYKQKLNKYNIGRNNSTSISELSEKRDIRSEDLIIEDNTVYEIDPECYEKAKRALFNQKNEWNKK